MPPCFFIYKYVPQLDPASHLHILCKCIIDVYRLNGLLGQAGEYVYMKNIETSPFGYLHSCNLHA